MATNNQIERAKKILAQYPTAKAVHFTSDGSPFVSDVSARNHTKALEDKAIETITREEANGAASAEPAGDTGKVATIKPLNKMNLEELGLEVKKREGLVISETAKTKKDIVTEIEAFDTAAAAATVTPAAEATAADTTEGGAGKTEGEE